MDGFFHQHFHHSLLEAGSDVFRHNGLAHHFLFIDIVQYGRFQTAEAEVIAIFLQKYTGEFHSIGIAFFGCCIDFRAAGITHTDGTGNFVISLTSGVISGSAQNFVFAIIGHIHQMRMTAGNHQRHIRRFKILIFNVVCTDMSFDVMDTHKGFICRKSKGLGFCQTYQQRPHQTWAISHTDGVNVLQCDACFLQSLCDNTINGFDMFPGCDFRHYAAIESMQCNL